MNVPEQPEKIDGVTYVSLVLHAQDPSLDVVHLTRGEAPYRQVHTMKIEDITRKSPTPELLQFIQYFRDEYIRSEYLSVGYNVRTNVCALRPRDIRKIAQKVTVNFPMASVTVDNLP